MVTILGVQAFLIFFIIPMVLGFWAQHRVKSTFAKNLEVPVEETPGSLRSEERRVGKECAT